MSGAQDATRLSNWVEDTVARVREAAASAPKGGDERWIGLLRELGVDIVGREPVLTPTNEWSAGYLETKRERMGHELPDVNAVGGDAE